MVLNQLMQFEVMSELQRIRLIQSILTSSGYQMLKVQSRVRKYITNYCYTKQGVPYVFIVIENKGKGYVAWTLIDYDVYQDLVINKGHVFRAEQCHHKAKYSIQFGPANVRVHSYVLPQASTVDHITGCKFINIRELLRPCTPQQNMKNVLRYCNVDIKNKSFYMKALELTPADKARLKQLGFTLKHLSKGDYLYSPRYNTLVDCYTVINQFERHFFGEFAFNPLLNFEYTWYALVLQKMLGTFSEHDLMEYNRSYWIRRRPADAEYYML